VEKWRESWGKSETPKVVATDTSKGTNTMKTLPDVKDPKKPAPDTAKEKKPAPDTAKEKKKPATDTAKEKKPTPALADLPHADPNKNDPLLGDPTQYARKPLDAKLPGLGDLPAPEPSKGPGAPSKGPGAPSKGPGAGSDGPGEASKGPGPRGDGPPANRGGAAPAPGAVEALPGGAKSVTDSGTVNQVPFPVVTMPQPVGPPPQPPTPHWQVPQAPQPITNPGGGHAPEALPGGIAYNAFTRPEFVPPAPGTPEQGMLGNAFSSDLDPVRPAPHPMPVGPPAGGVFGPAQPYPMAMSQAGPGPLNPMLPPAPYGPVVRLPVGPTPSNPMSQGTQLAMLPPPQDRGVVQAGYQAPAPAPAATMSAQQLGGMLHDALYPSQREWAAEKLSAYDWKQNDAALQALTQALREDPAATVRAACVRALAKMKANTYPVVSAIQVAKNDADPRVRTEADEALSILAPGATAPAALPAAMQSGGAASPASASPPAGAPATGSGSSLPPLTK